MFYYHPDYLVTGVNNKGCCIKATFYYLLHSGFARAGSIDPDSLVLRPLQEHEYVLRYWA